MSANRIFLVCAHCRELESALLLAERADGDAQYTAANMKRADDWYARHQRCGKGVDHYQLAYHRPIDWDVSPPAPPVAIGVRLALVNGDVGKEP
jgi:predicted N-acyltransferase